MSARMRALEELRRLERRRETLLRAIRIAKGEHTPTPEAIVEAVRAADRREGAA